MDVTWGGRGEPEPQLTDHPPPQVSSAAAEH